MSDEGSGLVRRGLVLVAGIGVLVVVVLSILLNRPGGGAAPKETVPSEGLGLLGSVGAVSFPGSLDWPALAVMPKVLPSGPGWEIRYNATLALARRGSPHLPLDNVREMLDESQQMRNFRAPLDKGGSVPDEAAARQTILSTLDALAGWWQKLPATDRVRIDREPALRAVRAELDRLAESPITTLWSKAQQTRKVLSTSS
jgi:hypothetical protein